MHVYDGVDPITFGSTGAPGVVVNPQPSGFGTYSLPNIVDDNDDRDAANVNMAPAANRDALNWAIWRIPDAISGGDYRSAFKGYVQMANAIFIDRSAASDLLPGLQVNGNASHGVAIGAAATSGDAFAIAAAGHGLGGGIIGFSGGSSGADAGVVGEGTLNAHGVRGTGNGAGAGLYGVGGSSGIGVWGIAGTGAPSLFGSGGPLVLDTNVGGPTVDPGGNSLWANQIPKAWAHVTSIGAAGTQTLDDGVNIASVTFSNYGGGSPLLITVTFARPVSTLGPETYYVVNVDLTSTAAPFVVFNLVKLSTGFSFNIWDVQTALAANVFGAGGQFGFAVYGTQ